MKRSSEQQGKEQQGRLLGMGIDVSKGSLAVAMRYLKLRKTQAAVSRKA